MVSPIKDESKGPAGMQVYGFDPEKEPEEAYKKVL